MKNTRKLLQILVCAALLLSIIACTSAEDEAVFDVDYDEAATTDFTGIDFTIGSGWAHTEWYPDTGFTYATDMQRDRIDSVKQKFGCTFTPVVMDDSTETTFYLVAAGLPTTDLFDGHVSNTGLAFYKANLLIPLRSVETIDSTDESKWGPFAFRSYGIFDGASYGFFTWQWQYILPTFSGVMAFNEMTIKQYSITEPYELQEKGVWNWDNFEALLAEAQSSVTIENFVPYTVFEQNTDHVPKSFMFSNGLDFVVRNGDKLEFGFNSPYASDALAFLAELYDRQLYSYKGGLDGFLNGKALFITTESDMVTFPSQSIPNTLEDYGFISFPYGPHGDPSTVSSYVHSHRRLNYFMAYGANDYNDAGTVADYLFTYLDGEDSGWEQWAKQSIFHYEQGWKNMMDMCYGMKYDYSAQLSGSADVFKSSILNAVAGKKTPAEAISSVVDKIENDISENLTWFYEPGTEY